MSEVVVQSDPKAEAELVSVYIGICCRWPKGYVPGIQVIEALAMIEDPWVPHSSACGTMIFDHLYLVLKQSWPAISVELKNVLKRQFNIQEDENGVMVSMI